MIDSERTEDTSDISPQIDVAGLEAARSAYLAEMGSSASADKELDATSTGPAVETQAEATRDHREGAPADSSMPEAERVARTQVESLEDALGKRLDEGIKEPVVALRAFGIPTNQSCEGHLDHGNPYPWVQIYAPEPEGWQTSQQLQAEWRVANESFRNEVAGLLDAFYQEHPSDPSVALHMAEMGVFGAFKLQSPPELINEHPPDAAQLVRYRQEMNDFAQFLLARQRP